MKRLVFVFSCLLLATSYLLLATAPAHAVLEDTKGVLTDSNIQPEPLTLGVSLGSVTSVRDLKDYIALGYRYAIGIVVICAIVMVVYGGFRYLIGSAMSDVSKAKKIIFDALMGLLIVLGAYLILNTINPATVKLQVPGLTSIGNRAACLGLVGCKSDKDCASDLKDQKSCGENAKCLFINNNEGVCTAGVAGDLCHCPSPGGCEAKCPNGDRTCNNGGTGAVACQTGLGCVMRIDSSLASGDWEKVNPVRPTCRKVREVTQIENDLDDKPNINGEGKKCVRDQDCKMGACIRISEGVGYCSNGSEGSRCRCSDKGCFTACYSTGFKEFTSCNNNNTGEIACDSGLECVLTKKGNRKTFIDGQWYCQKTSK
ncbi:hypothetical protein FJZ48_02710 [Candidatus Uhrbacteria bacterium]|nr:hypothetical protein [Candidatus Uhrbacteria bacterium]